MIRAIIVDDEYLARQRILKLLEAHDDIKVVGEAKNGNEAVEKINMVEPELVFLDIQMPDIDGFETIKRLEPKNQPYIVFTTAYDQYAIRAFDVHALDYLLKPIDEDRFNIAIKKVLKHFEVQKTSTFNKKLLKMMKEFEQPQHGFLTEIVISEKGFEHSVDLDEVSYLEANGNYISMHTEAKTHLHRSTMNALATQLNPDEFIRIHRSLIINRRFVKKCTYLSNNEYQFTMKDGQVLVSGRSYKSSIVEYLS